MGNLSLPYLTWSKNKNNKNTRQPVPAINNNQQQENENKNKNTPKKKTKQNGSKPERSLMAKAPMGVTEATVDAAISQFVLQYLDPQSPFVTPKFGAATYHPVLVTNRIVLEPSSGSSLFQGTIRVNKNFRNLITIHRAGSIILVPISRYATRTVNFDHAIVPPLKFLSFPGNWSGSVDAGPQLHRVSGDYAAYNPEHNRFEEGYAWMNPVRFGSTTAAVNSYINFVGPGGSNQGGGTFTVQAFVDDGEIYIVSSTVTNAALASGVTTASSTYTSSLGTSWTGVFYKPTAEVETASAVIETTTDQPVTTNGIAEIEIPVDRSQSFDALERSANFYCIETVTANFGWAGNKSASSGSVACATIPFGQPVPDDPDALMDYISKLPPEVRYQSSSGEGDSLNIEHGSRTVLTGSRIDDFKTIPISQNYEAPAAIFTWKVPPAGSAQPPQAVFTVKTVIAFQTTDPVYGPFKAPPGWDLVQQWADFQCLHNLNTSNDGHWEKYRHIISSAVKDPRMRSAAKMALQVAKVVGPMLVPRASSLLNMIPT